MKTRVLIIPTLLVWLLVLSAAMGHPVIWQFTGHIFMFTMGDFRILL